MRDFVGEQRLERMRSTYPRSIFFPRDEARAHRYRADSVEAAQPATARASLWLDRIAEAVIETGISGGLGARRSA